MTRFDPCIETSESLPKMSRWWARISVSRDQIQILVAIIVLIACWRWLWGDCWNPFATSCFSAPGDGDHVQHYYGWLAYARSGLSTWLPPRFPTWTWPIQVPLLFADPIPLAAILFAPLVRLLQIDFQYFSLLSLVNFLGTFLCGVWIGRYVSLPSWSATWLGLLLALSPPALIRMTSHEALSLHGILVLAIALIIRRQSSLKWWLPLVVVAMGIHAYFLPMILSLALFAQWACADETGTRHSRLATISLLPWVRLGLIAGVLLLGAVFLGYIPNHASVHSSGNMWSANLLALFDSQGKSLVFPGIAKQEPFQWEGFSYLGFFGIAVVCFAVGSRLGGASRHSENRTTIFPRPLAYAALMLVFALFSLGNHWFFGQQPLLRIGPDFPLLSQSQQIFRSSGRFMWPVYYSLVIWGYVSIMQVAKLPRLLSAVLLVLALESYLPTALLIHQVFAAQHADGVRWQRQLAAPSPTLNLLKKAEVLYNATGDASFFTETLPRFMPQAVNPAIVTNYNAYLARSPHGFRESATGAPCELVDGFLARASGLFAADKTYLIMRNSDQQACPLTRSASLELPLSAQEPTSVFLLERSR